MDALSESSNDNDDKKLTLPQNQNHSTIRKESLEGRAESHPILHELPVEVLTSILLWTLSMTGRHHPRPLFNLIMVCKYWHSVVFAEASFWTQINALYWPSTLRAYLLNSKNAPLEFTYDRRKDGTAQNESLKIIVEHAHRIRSIKFVGYDYSFLQQFMTSVSDLSIHRLGGASWDDAITLDIGDHPPLRNVHLYNAFLPWESLRIGQLRGLSLRSVRGRPPTVHQFRRILESSPLLEYLYLNDVGLKETEGGAGLVTTSLKRPAINLRCLAELELKDLPESLAEQLLEMFYPAESCQARFRDVDPSLAMKMMGQAGRTSFVLADRIQLEIRHRQLESTSVKPSICYIVRKGQTLDISVLIPAKIRDDVVKGFFAVLDESDVRCPIRLVFSSSGPRKSPLSTQLSSTSLLCLKNVDEIQFKRGTNPGPLLRCLAHPLSLCSDEKPCSGLKRLYVEDWRAGDWTAFQDFLQQRWEGGPTQPSPLDGWDVPGDSGSFEELKRDVNLHCQSRARIRSNGDMQNPEMVGSLFESL